MEINQNAETEQPGSDRVIQIIGEIASTAGRGKSIGEAIAENPSLSVEEKTALLAQNVAVNFRILANTPYCYALSENRPVALEVFDRLSSTYLFLGPPLYKSAMQQYGDFLRVCRHLNIDIGSPLED